MKNKQQEQQEIKNSLEKDIFSKHQFRSRRAEIMQKATEAKATSKKSVYFHYGLTAAAVVLLSVISFSFFDLNDNTNDQLATETHEEEPDQRVVVPPVDQIPTSKVEDYVKEQEPEEKPVEPEVEEENVDTQWDKTGEEWKKYFQGIYDEESTEINKHYLRYEVESLDTGEITEKEIVATFEGDQFIEKENTKNYKNGELIGNLSYYSMNDKVVIVNHMNKTFQHMKTSSISASEWKKDRGLYNGDPVYHLDETEFKDYEWSFVEKSEKENWVLLKLKGNDARNQVWDEIIAKIDYDTGIVLEKNGYNSGVKVTNIIYKELKLNEELKDLTLTLEVPDNYTNYEEILSELEKMKIKTELIDLATKRLLERFPSVERGTVTGEGHSPLYFVVSMEESTSDSIAKEAGKYFLDEFTRIVNASEEFKKKNKKVWDQGQYQYIVRVDVPKIASFYGRNNDKEQLTWEQKPYLYSE